MIIYFQKNQHRKVLLRFFRVLLPCGQWVFDKSQCSKSISVPLRLCVLKISIKGKSHVNPLQIPCKSHYQERIRSGLEADYKRRINEGITTFKLHCSLLQIEKQNFHTTRQLVTRSAVTICASENYTGDSFRLTRHPLITLK